jgi:hypothetical protein
MSRVLRPLQAIALDRTGLVGDVEQDVSTKISRVKRAAVALYICELSS